LQPAGQLKLSPYPAAATAVLVAALLEQAFCGACLLCLSALSTALTVLSGFLLSMAWIGVVLYTVLGEQATQACPMLCKLSTPGTQHLECTSVVNATCLNIISNIATAGSVATKHGENHS
jgi:hypothetical protein